MNYEQQISKMSKMVMDILKERNARMATAESCTGGMLASSMVANAGSSEVFEGGIVAYQNRVKHMLLNVSNEILENLKLGPVSPQCALRMCSGALSQFQEATYAVSTTGFAGPGGDDVGKVYIGIAKRGNTPEQIVCHEFHFKGDRDTVRQKAALAALIQLYYFIAFDEEYL